MNDKWFLGVEKGIFCPFRLLGNFAGFCNA